MGAPALRAFKMNEYEGYVSDSFARQAGTHLTLGCVIAMTGRLTKPMVCKWSRIFSCRTISRNELASAREGVASNAMPNAYLSYSLNGPVNGKPSWYGPDNNNFGPRLAVAYSPQGHDGLIKKIFGSQWRVSRGGAMLYDRYGSELITQFDQFGSFGLSTTLNNPVSYNFTDSPRYNGRLPASCARRSGISLQPARRECDLGRISRHLLESEVALFHPAERFLCARIARETDAGSSLMTAGSRESCCCRAMCIRRLRTLRTPAPAKPGCSA